MRLSPHFTSAEFACHDGTPAPAAYLRDARALCLDYLEPLRRAFGPVTIVSGYRTATHNRDVGGAPMSYHKRTPRRSGAAADVRCRSGAPRQWHAFLDALEPGGLGLYDGWVHVDNRSGHARW